MRASEIIIEADNSDISSLLSASGVKWRKMKKDSEGLTQIATVLKNNEVFMFYFTPGDRDTGWAVSYLEKGRNINDVKWDGSGTDDMNDAFSIFKTWRDTDGQQTNYEIEDEFNPYDWDEDDVTEGEAGQFSGQKWGVMSRVSGGITGTRESWLKLRGERMEFDSEEEAKQVAQTARESMGLGSGGVQFHYFVEPILNLWEDEEGCETCADLGYIPTTGEVCPDCGDGEDDQFNPYDWNSGDAEGEDSRLMASRGQLPLAQRRIRAHRLR